MKQKELVAICAVGATASFLAMAFGSGIAGLSELLWTPVLHMPVVGYLTWSFVILTLAGLLSGWMMAVWSPHAAGSGIPQLKAAYWRDCGTVGWLPVAVKFLAGIISIGGGMSLGKEGPTVFLAGGAGSVMAGRLGLTAKGRRLLTACGAAAGLAAAFNTPIAAVAFVLEELLENLNSRLMGRLLLASFISVFVLHWIRGGEGVLQLPEAVHFDWVVFLAAAPVALVAASAGGWFQLAALGWRRRIRAGSRLHPALRPLVGAWVTWALAAAAIVTTGHSGILGLGFADLNAALGGSLGVSVLAVLLVGKWLATVACYAWGGCGGIFAPTLFMGAMAGALFGSLLHSLGWVDSAGAEVLAVTGMCAFLCAVVRAPATAILIVFEMTHDFGIVPALMLGTLVAEKTAGVICKKNFYNQVLHDDGCELERYRPAEQFTDWKQRPLATYANFKPLCVPRDDRDRARQIATTSSYRFFPVVDSDGRLCGVTSSADITKSDESFPVAACRGVPPQTPMGEAQNAFLESSHDILVLVDPDNRPVAVLTLHDVMRIQLAAMSE